MSESPSPLLLDELGLLPVSMLVAAGQATDAIVPFLPPARPLQNEFAFALLS